MMRTFFKPRTSNDTSIHPPSTAPLSSDHISFADQVRYLSDSSSDEDDSKRDDEDDGECDDEDPANDNISLEPEVVGDSAVNVCLQYCL
jgi:hypothetical protein